MAESKIADLANGWRVLLNPPTFRTCPGCGADAAYEAVKVIAPEGVTWLACAVCGVHSVLPPAPREARAGR